MLAPCCVCATPLPSAVPTEEFENLQPLGGGEINLIFGYGSSEFDLAVDPTVFKGIICDFCAKKMMPRLFLAKNDWIYNADSEKFNSKLPEITEKPAEATTSDKQETPEVEEQLTNALWQKLFGSTPYIIDHTLSLGFSENKGVILCNSLTGTYSDLPHLRTVSAVNRFIALFSENKPNVVWSCHPALKVNQRFRYRMSGVSVLETIDYDGRWVQVPLQTTLNNWINPPYSGIWQVVATGRALWTSGAD